MSIVKKYANKLYLKQWGMGFMKGNIADIIRSKKTDLSFEWFPIANKSISQADPFIFKTKDGNINILFESVSTVSLDGKISLMVCNKDLEPVSEKTILDTKDHLSYPFVYRENGKIYVFPENALSGSLFAYEYDEVTRTLLNKKQVLDLPVLDATILQHEGKYWLFGTLLGKGKYSDLHIFHADNLMGPYQPHAGNPVKQNLDGSRPGGDFISIDGQVYRPTQNCSNYYGESITINCIKRLTTSDFVEEEYMTIRPNKKDEFNYGIHTINVVDDLIIVDGQKTYFQPVRQLGRKLKSFFNSLTL